MRRPAVLFALTAALLAAPGVRAEVAELRISRQFGIGYLPLQVAQNRGLFEKHAKAEGLDGQKVVFVTLGGGAATNDALLSESIHIATGGVGPFITAWAKTRGNLDIKGIAAVTTLPIALMTTNPAIRTLADFGPKDRIALPSVKVSIQAVTLQIAAEKVFGPGHHDALDPLTVSVKHPDAYAALASGKSELTAHFGAPPFQQQELERLGAHKVVDSYEALGGPTTLNVAWAKASFHAANPRTVRAFVAALREADEFIRRSPEEAARIHLAEEGGSADLVLVRSIVKEPHSIFSTAPLNVTKYADFLFRTGQIKVKAGDWRELFFPEIHGETGS